MLDPLAAKHRGRERSEARTRLKGLTEALTEADLAGQLTIFVESAGERGSRRAELAARTGWRDTVLNKAAAEAIERGAVVEAEEVYVGQASFARLVQATAAEVEAHHRREPLARGMARETLRERVFAHTAPEVFRRVLTHAEAAGVLASERELVRLRTHSLQLSTADAEVKHRLEQIYGEAGLEAPTFDEALSQLSGKAVAREHARKLLQLLINEGVLVRVREDFSCTARRWIISLNNCMSTRHVMNQSGPLTFQLSRIWRVYRASMRSRCLSILTVNA